MIGVPYVLCHRACHEEAQAGQGPSPSQRVSDRMEGGGGGVLVVTAVSILRNNYEVAIGPALDSYSPQSSGKG